MVSNSSSWAMCNRREMYQIPCYYGEGVDKSHPGGLWKVSLKRWHWGIIVKNRYVTMWTKKRPFHMIRYYVAQRSSGWMFPSLPGSGILSLSILSPHLHGLWRFIKPLTEICVYVCVCVCVYSLGRGHLFSSDLFYTERCFEMFCW